ncbi:major facilitator superfamily domain-containing protein [Leptodontidium sp. MPI-SDFR-AT-0119]|nr:major facilitator superfamily domain-containing protein [Leptodontidium sp. MPI-SDFR-AT-0119]
MSASMPTEESALLGETESASTHSQDVNPHPWMILRIGAAMYSFAFLGLFASSIGVMLQPLIQQYSLSDLHVSLVFVVGPVGYIFAAQFSSLMHWNFGQRGVAILAPALHLVGVLVIATHPPFAIVLLAFAATAFGAGFLDGSLCAWAATVPNANFVTGMLQGSYSVGAAVGPFLAGTVLPAWGRPWYDWYYVLVVASVLELCLLSFACRHETAARYRGEKQDEEVSLRLMFNYRATWLVALYFFAYVGIETAISGWMVTFMIRFRHMVPELASMSSSSFWGGMAAGRFTLGAMTDKIGVGRANVLYFLVTIAFQVAFTFIREDMLSVVIVGFIGFFMGPMFASGIVQVTRLLPAELHIAAVSFGASAGQIGAALLPFGIGAFIQRAGISIFPFAILTLSVFTLLSWLPMIL